MATGSSAPACCFGKIAIDDWLFVLIAGAGSGLVPVSGWATPYGGDRCDRADCVAARFGHRQVTDSEIPAEVALTKEAVQRGDQPQF